MTSVVQGAAVTLEATFYSYPSGPAVDLTGTTIAISTADGVTTVVAATSTGVTHPATGVYTYAWAVPAGQATGDYLVLWSGNAGAVTASELVTVTAAASAGTTSSDVDVWYCTREDVKRALDVAETARTNAQIDRAISSGSRNVEGLCHRVFYPTVATKSFDWPNFQYARSWRLWLDQHELISLTTLTSGGVEIPEGNYFLEPANDGPPFRSIEVNLASSSAFQGGDTHQRSIVAEGLWGFNATTAPAGALAEALDDAETAVDVTDSAAVGVGQLIQVESERMLVTGKAMLDTGVNIDAADSLAASMSDVSITLSTTTGAPVVDEVILVGSERMLVVDVAGTVLTVKRAWDGSVLATHAGSADIYAPRTLTVTRGALGTTAAAHSNGVAITRHVYPGLVRDLAVAYALNQALQEGSGYARVSGSGDNAKEFTGRGVKQIEDDCYARYGRKARSRAV